MFGVRLDKKYDKKYKGIKKVSVKYFDISKAFFSKDNNFLNLKNIDDETKRINLQYVIKIKIDNQIYVRNTNGSWKLEAKK